MSEYPTPPPMPPPPPISAVNATSGYPENPDAFGLGQHPDDIKSIDGFTGLVEAILRFPRRLIYQISRKDGNNVSGRLFVSALLCTLVYGLIVGSFSGGNQLWIAPIKISAGILLSGLLCLPSLYIFASLGGSRASVAEVSNLLLGLVALATLLLIGFAPVAWVFSRSIDSIAGMGALHLIFCFVSVCFGFRFLRVAFRHLGARSTAGINLWFLIFLMVMLQMTTSLRPLIGTSDHLLAKEKKFFIAHWMDNLSTK